MDSEAQRTNMVNSQVRPSDITDRRIPRAMLAVPRERFAPPAQRLVAYMDDNLRVTDPGAPVRHLLAPRTLAKMVQALELPDDAFVLDLAPATGYSTAVLAHIARDVVAVEPDQILADRARSALTELGITNASVETGAPAGGAPRRAPFDAILINGAIEEMPLALLDQLKSGARLCAIRSASGVGRVTLWRRFEGRFDERSLFDAAAGPVAGFTREVAFSL